MKSRFMNNSNSGIDPIPATDTRQMEDEQILYSEANDSASRILSELKIIVGFRYSSVAIM